jgi:hypothetical protein
VDILVIMPALNELDQAVRISLAVDYNFPLDLVFRTPKNLAWRVAEGDSFLKEVMDRGKVLDEKYHRRVGEKGGTRSSRRAKAGAAAPPQTPISGPMGGSKT